MFWNANLKQESISFCHSNLKFFKSVKSWNCVKVCLPEDCVSKSIYRRVSFARMNGCMCFKSAFTENIKRWCSSNKVFYWIYKSHKCDQIQILWFKICLPESWVNIASKMNEKNRQTGPCVLKAHSQKTLKDNIHEFKMTSQTNEIIHWIDKSQV